MPHKLAGGLRPAPPYGTIPRSLRSVGTRQMWRQDADGERDPGRWHSRAKPHVSVHFNRLKMRKNNTGKKEVKESFIAWGGTLKLNIVPNSANGKQ